jgi:hypothetical protein
MDTYIGKRGYSTAIASGTSVIDVLRTQIIPASGETDWMEWLACYVSAAMLMPRSRAQLHIAAFRAERQRGAV